MIDRAFGTFTRMNVTLSNRFKMRVNESSFVEAHRLAQDAYSAQTLKLIHERRSEIELLRSDAHKLRQRGLVMQANRKLLEAMNLEQALEAFIDSAPIRCYDSIVEVCA